MTPPHKHSTHPRRYKPLLLPLCVAAAVLTQCAPTKLPPAEGEHQSAVLHLKQASKKTLTPEQRAVLYLDSAKEASALLGSRTSSESARVIYNQSAADLTVLLRKAALGQMWNRPLTLSSNGTTYHLRFAKGNSEGIWDPNYFTDFTPAAEVEMKSVKRRNHQQGFGGALVGTRKPDPLEPFSPRIGVTAPATAILDFKGNDVTLTLADPLNTTKSLVAGSERTLEADYSAPLAHYPHDSELWNGLMGALRVSDHMKTTGLYMLQPYDPDRIPLIFVHGLISTPRMWRNVINELEMDPTIRERYQCWVFGYPTGNPPLYSALRFREELEKLNKLHPEAKKYVLVGHSMGGIVSRTQTTTVDRKDWDAMGKDTAEAFFANITKGSLIDRCTTFNANPRVGRAVFICAPHRGSEMAISSIGEMAMRLIALPIDITSQITGSVAQSIAIMSGDSKRLPNSVSGLSPKNPAYKTLDKCRIEAPHHSIIGDRGKGDTPNSSDGVVEYWSSHLKSASSEKIVPGPHGACELPETLAELKRILHLHLKQN